MKQEKTYFDIQYIKRFKEGDDAAFEVIYEYYKQHIYYMGMQLFNRDQERSKDLVQNTFSEIYINIKKLKSVEAFYVWMNQIAYRQGCNMLRYQSKDSTYYAGSSEEEFIDFIPEHNPVDIVSELQRKEAVNIILECLGKMDDDKRLIGYLRYFEELSIKEIAEVTGIKENTVMSHLHRTKAYLKKKLEDYGFTSATCFSLLLVPNLIEYYQALVQLDEPMKEEGTKAVHEKVKAKEEKTKSTYWNYVAKVIASMIVVIPVFTIAGESVYKSMEESAPLPVFTSVNYDTSLRKEAIVLDVKTSNRNYDKILLNDTTNLVISMNGTYMLSLIKDSEIIDSKKIVIQNIERNAPEVISQDIQEESITFYVQDDVSGVDFNNIVYLVNKNIVKDFQIDQSLGQITIPYDKTTNGYLKIPDNVGNVLNVKIDSYTVAAN